MSAMNGSTEDSEPAIEALLEVRESARSLADQLEEGPDYDALLKQRRTRNDEAMRAADPTFVKAMMHKDDLMGKETKAAITIQSFYRGYRARCAYVERLYDKYEQEEDDRRQKTEDQVEEGELLVQTHSLQLDLEEAEMAYRNRERRRTSHAITIQRAWRKYWKKRHPAGPPPRPSADGAVTALGSEALGLPNLAEMEGFGAITDSVNGSATGSVRNSSFSTASHPAFYVDTASDRKASLLSLAHEFAHLKSQFADALPYDAHMASLRSDSSTGSSAENSAVHTPVHDNTLPVCDSQDTVTEPLFDCNDSLPDLFSNKPLDAGTRKACQSEKLAHVVVMSAGPPVKPPRLTDRSSVTTAVEGVSKSYSSIKDAHREDVRKRLAMNMPTDTQYSEGLTRSFSKSSRAPAAMELYINDCNEEDKPPSSIDTTDSHILSTQLLLEEKASIAYVQAAPIARKLIAVEKMSQKPSAVAEMLGITSFRSNGDNALSKQRLLSLALPQLQVVYNAVQNEIEGLNEELVHSVMTKDDLHMQQDSLLVNIEDLQRRLEELAQRHKEHVKRDGRERKPEHKLERKLSAVSKLFRLGKT